MDRRSIYWLTGVMAALLGGCDSEPKAPRQTPEPSDYKAWVEYWQGHPREVIPAVQDCQQRLGRKRDTWNGRCLAAWDVALEDVASKPANSGG